MSKEIAIGIVIGGAVSASLGAAVGRTGTALTGLQKKLADTRNMQSMIGKTQELHRAYSTAFKSGAKDADLLRGKIDKQHQALKAAGIDVANLDREYKRLGRTVKGIEWQTAGAAKVRAGAELGRTALAGLSLGALPTKISGDFQAEIRDIAIKSAIAGKPQEQQMAEQIRKTAERQKIARGDLARAVNGLVTQGMDWQASVGYGDLLGELTVGQKMDPEDAAKLIYAFQQNGVAQAEMRKVMGEIAVAGDLGAFESDKMAKFLPELMATVGSMGLRGQKAARFLSASLQAQIKLTGDADSAATNFKNLLSKIISSDTAAKFEKAEIDLQSSMTAYIEEGYNPIDAFLALTERLIVKSDPARAKRMAALKQKIQSSAGNSKEEAEALNAYLQSVGLADIITDMQARSAALAQIKYAGQIKQDLSTIEKTDGGAKLAKDKASRDETSNRKWESVGHEFSAWMGVLGDAIRPVTDRLADFTATVLRIGSAATQSHPSLGLGVLAGGAVALGFAAKKIVSGTTQWAMGKVLARLGGRLTGGGAKGPTGAVGAALEQGSGAGEQRVYVTNWPAGRLDTGGSLDPADASRGKDSRREATKRRRMGKLGSALKGTGAFLARHAGALFTLGASAYQVYDTAQHAKTAEQKGQGYGGAAGSLAGGISGAKLGAIIGTAIAPGIGTAIGGALGGVAGTVAGNNLGAWLGKVIAQVASTPAKAMAPPNPSAAKPVPKPVSHAEPATRAAPPLPASGKKEVPTATTRSRVVQHVFKPTIQVTVKGDVKDPRQLAAEIAPHLKRIFDDWQQRSMRSALFDSVG